MQIYPATVEFPAPAEPFEGNWGPKYSVALRPDDVSAPKVSDGLIKIYRSPDHSSTPYMRSLAKGDRVQLVYIEKGGMSYYDFVMNTEPQPTTHTAPVESARTVTYSPPAQQNSKPQAPQTRIYMPFSDEETETFIKIAQEQVEIILSLMKSIPDDGLDLSTEDLRAIAVTAYIQANKVYNRGMVLEELLPELFDDEPDGDDVNQEAEDLKRQFKGMFTPHREADKPGLANAFLKICSQLFGASTDNLIAIHTKLGLTSDLVYFNPDDSFEVLHSYYQATSNQVSEEDAVKFAKGMISQIASEMGGDDDVPF